MDVLRDYFTVFLFVVYSALALRRELSANFDFFVFLLYHVIQQDEESIGYAQDCTDPLPWYGTSIIRVGVLF